MGKKLIITRERLEACHPCNSEDFENSPRWDGYALVYEDIDIEIARLAAIPGGVALTFLAKHGLIPNFTIKDAIVAIRRAMTEKVK